MKERLRLVVSGGGTVGLATAALCAQLPQAAALDIAVVDAQPPPADPLAGDTGLRVSAVSAGSLALLDRVGARAALAARECAYRDMRVWDARGAADGQGALRFAAAEMALPALGAIVEDELLRHSLYRVLASSPVTLRFGAAVDDIVFENGVATLGLADGDRLHAELLVGADGARSPVRQAAGIDTDGWRYPQAAVVTHARPARPHAHTAWQRFLPDGPLALLPLADGRVSIVWSTAPDAAEALLACDSCEFSARLTAASDGVLGDLEVAAPRASFPLSARHARHYVRRGLALVGDAAHTVHPLAGQGANLGLADAAEFAATVGAALAAGEYPADLPVLRRYERARRGANATMLYFIDVLNRLFAADAGLAAGLRRSGMRLFNAAGPLKRRAMRVALGL